MSSFRRSYTLKENKPISKMNKKDIILALQAEELNSHRWTEDILELLIKKELLTLEELPVTVQTRLLYKKELRQRLTEITTVNN
jgi:UDP-N-acetyl-D-mannosaminuronic acid transferase (WecB/TagA/CpsF family)